MSERKSAFIDNSDIEERIIFENELVRVFPTNIPIVPGHLLVIPKRCVHKFSDLSKEERDAIFETLEICKKALEKSFDAKGFNCAWNEGELSGQSVPHLHIHLLPRKEGDKGILNYDPREFLYRPNRDRRVSPNEELKEVAILVKKNL